MRCKVKEYLKTQEQNLTEEFTDNANITKEIFFRFEEFITDDWAAVAENKCYRIFLNVCKDIIVICFENNVSKSYMRSLFEKLNESVIIDCLSCYMKGKEATIRYIMNRFVNMFVYWQDPENTKKRKLDEILDLITGWM